MLTPSTAEGYSLSPSAARGLKLHIFVGISKFFRRNYVEISKCWHQKSNYVYKKCPASSRRRALELKITITFLLCNKYPHEYKKQKLPVSDTELIVSCFGTEGLNSTVAARLRGISASWILLFYLSQLSQMWVHPALAIADVSIFPSMLPWPFLFPYWE